ncbi:hypothetical protein CEP82_001365 [Mobiluncus mulieris]|nr:hypothetical protein CEP82_001365 [Mobiluncus mulieris]
MGSGGIWEPGLSIKEHPLIGKGIPGLLFAGFGCFDGIGSWVSCSQPYIDVKNKELVCIAKPTEPEIRKTAKS